MLNEIILKYYNERKGKFLEISKEGDQVYIAYKMWIDRNLNEDISGKDQINFADYQQGIEKLLSAGSCTLEHNHAKFEISKDDSKGVYLNIIGSGGTLMGIHLSVSPEKFMYKGGRK
jgi:hypothetical protein